MIGGLFIPNKSIAIAISLSGLLLLLTTVWDNWYKMDEKTKLGLMAATFVVLIAPIINMEKSNKVFKIGLVDISSRYNYIKVFSIIHLKTINKLNVHYKRTCQAYKYAIIGCCW